MLNFLLKKNAIPSDSKAAIMKAIATRCSPVSHLHPSIANKIAILSQPAQGKSQTRAEGTRHRLQYAVPRDRITKIIQVCSLNHYRSSNVSQPTGRAFELSLTVLPAR